MDCQRLRAIILDIEYHLSDEDRRRLHFYVGGAVPRRLQDDTSLAGTLNMMERLIEEGRISENDFTFLIDALDQIHCMNAVELLKGKIVFLIINFTAVYCYRTFKTKSIKRTKSIST
jgi:hypothetical protein